MRIRIEKSRAEGRICAPTSKSMAHRLLIAAALCEGESFIKSVTLCEDVLATVDCLRELGVSVDFTDDGIRVSGGIGGFTGDAKLNCRESGSTLRFMIPIALLLDRRCIFCGAESLMARPLSEYEALAEKEGYVFEKNGTTLTVKGKLKGGDYYLKGNVSSQFVTGLMLALSTLDTDSRIHITTALESKSYIELTRAAVAEFGPEIIWESDHCLYIKGAQKYYAKITQVEGDYSGAAFLDAFNLIGGNVRVEQLCQNSLQGDRAYKEHFSALEAEFANIDIQDCPDLGPILFTVAAIKHGGEFTGTKRLRIKESDRATAMKEELSKFGAEIIIEDNLVRVNKTALHSPNEIISGHNDHRIVMSMAVICSLFGGEIEGCEAVKKSYPDFFDHIKKLGIMTYEIY